jgi:hypothetical protein
MIQICLVFQAGRHGSPGACSLTLLWLLVWQGEKVDKRHNLWKKWMGRWKELVRGLEESCPQGSSREWAGPELVGAKVHVGNFPVWVPSPEGPSGGEWKMPGEVFVFSLVCCYSWAARQSAEPFQQELYSPMDLVPF